MNHFLFVFKFQAAQYSRLKGRITYRASLCSDASESCPFSTAGFLGSQRHFQMGSSLSNQFQNGTLGRTHVHIFENIQEIVSIFNFVK